MLESKVISKSGKSQEKIIVDYLRDNRYEGDLVLETCEEPALDLNMDLVRNGLNQREEYWLKSELKERKALRKEGKEVDKTNRLICIIYSAGAIGMGIISLISLDTYARTFSQEALTLGLGSLTFAAHNFLKAYHSYKG